MRRLPSLRNSLNWIPPAFLCHLLSFQVVLLFSLLNIFSIFRHTNVKQCLDLLPCSFHSISVLGLLCSLIPHLLPRTPSNDIVFILLLHLRPFPRGLVCLSTKKSPRLFSAQHPSSESWPLLGLDNGLTQQINMRMWLSLLP